MMQQWEGLSTSSWTPEPSTGLAGCPTAQNILLLLGCMNCWPAEICMISKLLQIRASTLWSPLIVHERVRFQCCGNRLRPALSNVLMEITTDLLIAGMSSTLRSYPLETWAKLFNNEAQLYPDIKHILTLSGKQWARVQICLWSHSVQPQFCQG